MKTWTLLLAPLSALVLAQTPAPPPGPIAMDRPETQAGGRLTVSSPAFGNGTAIPNRYTRYGDNLSPPLAWTRARGAKVYALIVDDPDGTLKPVTHWTIWNMTGTRLPEHLPTDARLATPTGVQGTTTMRGTGFAGPHPPIGDAAHHYHFQVFALDAPLLIAPAADRETLLVAMKGHVVARGELVGLYGQPAAPGK
ncbi:YbhB/YbcL family Raf kinase inhibitor-like protein [Sphingomonas bacterium]|uniref:YbhB/YbcL family Raf kinase inhibitor-like protein n=1 Tax=Sphingomonas bacterium TaxID=1895847 RepID=UPI001576F363|nr:YbhB/YbcL family Raf kinase inhibitor-like protein [Sphingomonas bacterium]